MKIAFFGLPLAALLLAKDGHDLVYAGICRRSAIGTRRLQRQLGKRVTILPKLEDALVQKTILDAHADILVSWYWTKKIPSVLRAAHALGSFGIHPSLLPRHRGSDPFFWAIDSGDHETGVTAHRLEDDYDTGAILESRALAIDPAWTSWRLAKKLDRPSLALLRDVARKFSAGTPPHETPQNEALMTIANEPTEDELEIDWTLAAEKIARRVRAASPYPGAFTFIGEQAITLTRVVVLGDSPRELGALAPGEAAVLADGRVVVRAGESGVQLLSARVERTDGDPSKEPEDVDLDERGLAEIVTSALALP